MKRRASRGPDGSGLRKKRAAKVKSEKTWQRAKNLQASERGGIGKRRDMEGDMFQTDILLNK
jgi:hypothetical protein